MNGSLRLCGMSIAGSPAQRVVVDRPAVLESPAQTAIALHQVGGRFLFGDTAANSATSCVLFRTTFLRMSRDATVPRSSLDSYPPWIGQVRNPVLAPA